MSSLIPQHTAIAEHGAEGRYFCARDITDVMLSILNVSATSHVLAIHCICLANKRVSTLQLTIVGRLRLCEPVASHDMLATVTHSVENFERALLSSGTADKINDDIHTPAASVQSSLHNVLFMVFLVPVDNVRAAMILSCQQLVNGAVSHKQAHTLGSTEEQLGQSDRPQAQASSAHHQHIDACWKRTNISNTLTHCGKEQTFPPH